MIWMRLLVLLDATVQKRRIYVIISSILYILVKKNSRKNTAINSSSIFLLQHQAEVRLWFHVEFLLNFQYFSPICIMHVALLIQHRHILHHQRNNIFSTLFYLQDLAVSVLAQVRHLYHTLIFQYCRIHELLYQMY